MMSSVTFPEVTISTLAGCVASDSPLSSRSAISGANSDESWTSVTDGAPTSPTVITACALSSSVATAWLNTPAWSGTGISSNLTVPLSSASESSSCCVATTSPSKMNSTV